MRAVVACLAAAMTCLTAPSAAPAGEQTWVDLQTLAGEQYQLRAVPETNLPADFPFAPWSAIRAEMARGAGPVEALAAYDADDHILTDFSRAQDLVTVTASGLAKTDQVGFPAQPVPDLEPAHVQEIEVTPVQGSAGARTFAAPTLFSPDSARTMLEPLTDDAEAQRRARQVLVHLFLNDAMYALDEEAQTWWTELIAWTQGQTGDIAQVGAELSKVGFATATTEIKVQELLVVTQRFVAYMRSVEASQTVTVYRVSPAVTRALERVSIALTYAKAGGLVAGDLYQAVVLQAAAGAYAQERAEAFARVVPYLPEAYQRAYPQAAEDVRKITDSLLSAFGQAVRDAGATYAVTLLEVATATLALLGGPAAAPLLPVSLVVVLGAKVAEQVAEQQGAVQSAAIAADVLRALREEAIPELQGQVRLDGAPLSEAALRELNWLYQMAAILTYEYHKCAVIGYVRNYSKWFDSRWESRVETLRLSLHRARDEYARLRPEYGFLPISEFQRLTALVKAAEDYTTIRTRNFDVVVVNQIGWESYPVIRVVVSVIDRSGEPVTGLTAADFEVLENGEPIRPLTVTDAGTAEQPVLAVLVLDCSGSMDGQPLQDSKNAAVQFVNGLQPGDAVGIVEFADTVSVALPPTQDLPLAGQTVQQLQTHGGTALCDAMYSGGELTESGRGRKIVIVLTDGMENSSHAHSDPGDAIALANRLSIPLVTIGFGGQLDEALLRRIADETNGSCFIRPTSSDLSQIYGLISRQLENQYVIQYTTRLAQDILAQYDVTVAGISDSGKVTDHRTFQTPEAILRQEGPIQELRGHVARCLREWFAGRPRMLAAGAIGQSEASAPLYYEAQPGEDFVALVQWAGSVLALEVYDPDGRLDGRMAPLCPPAVVRVKGARPGIWSFRVVGEDVPRPDYPYVLAVADGRAWVWPVWRVALGTRQGVLAALCLVGALTVLVAGSRVRRRFVEREARALRTEIAHLEHVREARREALRLRQALGAARATVSSDLYERTAALRDKQIAESESEAERRLRRLLERQAALRTEYARLETVLAETPATDKAHRRLLNRTRARLRRIEPMLTALEGALSRPQAPDHPDSSGPNA